MKEVAATRSITLGDDQPLTITLQIGNVQRGGTVILLQRNGTTAQLAKANIISGLIIGTGTTLRGGIVQVITVVVDVNPDSDWTNVMHQLTPRPNELTTSREDFHELAPADRLVRYTISYQIS